MEEEGLGAIGFMFDSEHHKDKREISIGDDITITVKTIGDRPGHVQSGQYLWPAATAASHHICSSWLSLKADRVLELGAGCGLTGLVASKLDGKPSVVFTDYDPGSLDLIRENVGLNWRDSGAHTHHVHFLEWGVPVPEDTKVQCSYPPGGFALIVGADLLYCKEVVDPLFTTVRELLDPERGLFILTTSFSLDEVSLCALYL